MADKNETEDRMKKEDLSQYDTDNVKWSPTDAFPRELAYFMQYFAHDHEQSRLLEEFENVASLRKVIAPVVKNGMLIKFNIPSKQKYERAKNELKSELLTPA